MSRRNKYIPVIAPLFSEKTTLDNSILTVIAHTPTQSLHRIASEGFFKKLTDADFMRIATLLAQKGYDEGGCPIGAVVISNETRIILGKGHNTLVQDNDPLCHGETAAIRDAGRQDFSKTTLYTTLSPCGTMCTPSIIKLGFNSLVIGDNFNVDNTANEKILRDHGIIVKIQTDTYAVNLYRQYKQEKPDQDLEDWKGLAAVNHAGCNHS